ncbi:hypothetical protein GXW82_27340 [Streptacidiphilus sp. 4-A2]|nr:hypothetical protein [Streptacidiphilus sp. 4-A2]
MLETVLESVLESVLKTVRGVSTVLPAATDSDKERPPPPAHAAKFADPSEEVALTCGKAENVRAGALTQCDQESPDR